MKSDDCLSLFVDSSVSNLSVVLMKNMDVLTHQSFSLKSRCMEDVHNIIFEILDTSNCSISDLEYLSCVMGPGAYTALRLGVTTVKTIAQLVNCPIIGLSLVDALLMSLADGVYFLLLPGRKHHFNVQLCRVTHHHVEYLTDLLSLNNSQLERFFQRFNSPVVCKAFGDAAFFECIKDLNLSMLVEDVSLNFRFLSQYCRMRYEKEDTDDLSSILPIYAHDVV